MERIYHTWEKWESYHARFFENTPPDGMTSEDAERLYSELLADLPEFKKAMEGVITEWKFTCEHNLTNASLNRIAFMGQAALAYRYKIPSKFRGGYNRLTLEQQNAADLAALEYINKWMLANGYEPLPEGKAKAEGVKQQLY